MIRKHMAPEAENGAGGQVKPKRTAGLPTKDTDFMNVAKAVSANWLADPSITLSWYKAADFNTLVQSYAADLSDRISKGSNRPSQTRQLEKLDERTDEALKDVKVYIQKKFKKVNAEAEYARYGIIKDGSYRFPRDRDKRPESLKLMINAISKDGFNDEEYGKDFWTQLQSEYATLMTAANATDGAVSGKVAGKNDKKEEIKKVMLALRRVLEANYPDTYKAVYRKWGWQKEDY